MTTPTVTLPESNEQVIVNSILIQAMKCHNQAMNDLFDEVITKDEYLYIVAWYNRIQAKYKPDWKPFRTS